MVTRTLALVARHPRWNTHRQSVGTALAKLQRTFSADVSVLTKDLKGTVREGRTGKDRAYSVFGEVLNLLTQGFRQPSRAERNSWRVSLRLVSLWACLALCGALLLIGLVQALLQCVDGSLRCSLMLGDHAASGSA